MILQELFNTVYPVAITRNEEHLFRMAFFDPVALVPVVVNGFNLSHGAKRSMWEVDFKRGGETYITKQKNAYKIFSTVLECIRRFIDTKDPDIIILGAEEQSRQSLYRAIISKFLNSTNYRMANNDDHSDIIGGAYKNDPSVIVLIKK